MVNFAKSARTALLENGKKKIFLEEDEEIKPIFEINEKRLRDAIQEIYHNKIQLNH